MTWRPNYCIYFQLWKNKSNKQVYIEPKRMIRKGIKQQMT